MNKYTIVRIDEPDFGCEGLLEGCVRMDQVWFEDETGERKMLEVADALLYEKDLTEGMRISEELFQELETDGE